MLKAGPIAFLLAAIYFAVALFRARRRPQPWTRHALQGVFVLYLLALMAVTLFPIPIDRRALAQGAAATGAYHYNLIPFLGVADALTHNPYVWLSSLQVAGNAVLLAPLGFLLPLLSRRVNTAGKAALTGFLTSLAIELTQLILGLLLGYMYRIVDVDDLILNTTGALVGYLLLRGLMRMAGARHKADGVPGVRRA